MTVERKRPKFILWGLSRTGAGAVVQATSSASALARRSAAMLAGELVEARKSIAAGEADESLVAGIHERFTYQMHDSSQFMKGLFNRTHSRTGTLWEERFKSVIVESGAAARTMGVLHRFREGAVIGSREFVNEAFVICFLGFFSVASAML